MITDEQKKMLIAFSGAAMSWLTLPNEENSKKYNLSRAALEAEFARLNGEVERLTARVEHLTGMVKRAEWGDEYIYCPWCAGFEEDCHTDDCPAFTPGGDVK